MTCPFTGEAGKGIREIGDGATVCPGLRLMLWDGLAITLRANYANDSIHDYASTLEDRIAKCIADRGCKLVLYKQYRVVCISIASTKIFISIVDSIRLSHCVRVLQRSVRRWLKMRNDHKFAVALEAYRCQYSPLSVLPIDLFMANIAQF